MAQITIVGAGMMGSAMSVPASVNNHRVRLVGTPLDTAIIDRMRKDHYHMTLARQLPESVELFQHEELEKALEGTDLLIGGVSSFGVDWFAETVLTRIPETLPVLSITKGMAVGKDGTLQSLPKTLRERLAPKKLSLNAVGGPCICFELVEHRHTQVAYCGTDMAKLEWIKSLLATDFYHITPSTDIEGVECAVAMKNAYAACVSLAIGLEGREDKYNQQAALFGQSVLEMSRLIRLVGGQEENVRLAAGDLYVTIFGGRTRRLGTLLGKGLTFPEAKAELAGITLESVAIATRAAESIRTLESSGRAAMKDYPLLNQLDAIINQGAPVNLPWDSFGR